MVEIIFSKGGMKLSIITITYNNLNGLKRTLNLFEKVSFKEQIEYVIVDGGSSDGTKDYLQNQNLTHVWVSEPDKGIYNAMNKGLSLASGEFVWFLNAGDYVEDLSVVQKILSNLELDIDALYGETMIVNELGEHLGTRSELSTRKLPKDLNWTSFRMGMNVGHQSFIIRKELAETYDESIKHVSDIDWMIRSLKNCSKVRNINQIISCFTIDGHSTIHRKQSNKERFDVLSRHYGYFPNLWAHLKIVLRKIFSPFKI
ncbi:MAG: glycosyltransferase family 2 protein [Bacteroidia bacterium]